MFKGLKEKFNIFKKKVEEEKKEIVNDDYFTEGIGKKINEKKLDEILDDLVLSLVESDVAYDVAEVIRNKIKEKVLNKKVKFGTDIENLINLILKDTLLEILNVGNLNIVETVKNAQKPYVIMVLGVNGTGKTTSIAKLANLFIKNNLSVVIAASDTFRAGAIDQLEHHSKNLNVTLIKHQPGSDPASVAYDAIEHAKSKGKHVVIIDTAGRMQTNKNLIEEMRKIKRVAKPNLTIFVGDALAGNDIIEQAKVFEKEVGFDAIILTKVDADAKGGGTISLAHLLKKPIIFLGTGQNYDDILFFNPSDIVEKILD
ncbi:MAG: signal recognition particle-docking protein FtsY [Thermoplasmata archaeon]|jgi:fused signal recognition particle receptor